LVRELWGERRGSRAGREEGGSRVGGEEGGVGPGEGVLC